MDKPFIRFLTRLVEIFIVVDLAVLTALVFANVALRYLANTSITATEELALYMLIWLVYMGAILAFAENSHISVDLINRKFSPPMQKIARFLCDALMLGACVMLLIGCYIQGSIDMGNLEIITGIPRGLRFVCGSVFSVAIILLLLARMYNTITSKPQGAH